MEWITFVIAIWGAALATFLGIREFLKDRRQIRIILEYQEFTEIVQIRIINIGIRPITISNVIMNVFFNTTDKQPKHWERVPANALFGTRKEDDSVSLPVTIEDGKQITLQLSEVVYGALMENRMRAKICVYDAEGREYTRFDRLYYNAKWGGYSKPPQ